MTKDEFIEELAKYVKQYAPLYNVCVYSPIIAQSCIESAYGTSELAIYCRNFFGLKFNDQVSGGGKYLKVGSEQNPDGSYTPSLMEWCTFDSLASGTQGYFEFLFGRTGITRYDNLKGITDCREYLETIKADGYCTSQNYVENCMRIVEEYNLQRFDDVQPTPAPSGYTNSPLVSYVDITPNSNPRTDASKYGCIGCIDTITIHHMAGALSLETCGRVFHNKSGSSNYGVDNNGKVAMYVEEKNRAWTSSNRANDFRAVTIEVANTPEGVANKTWAISDEALQGTINLVADICKRNGIISLVWSNNRDDRVNHRNGANLTMHKDFSATACPGAYIEAREQYIADEVTKILNGGVIPTPVPSNKPTIAKPTLKKGSTGTEALNLQKDLNYLGYTDANNCKLIEDSCLGQKSIEALKKFQGNNGLVADGIYGNASYNMMVTRIS